jgi:hypothetical protein
LGLRELTRKRGEVRRQEVRSNGGNHANRDKRYLSRPSPTRRRFPRTRRETGIILVP